MIIKLQVNCACPKKWPMMHYIGKPEVNLNVMILTIENLYPKFIYQCSKLLSRKLWDFVLGGWKVLLSNIIKMLPHLRFSFNFKVNTSIISLVPMLSASEATLPAFGQRVRASSSVLQDPRYQQHSQRFPSPRNIIYYRQIGAWLWHPKEDRRVLCCLNLVVRRRILALDSLVSRVGQLAKVIFLQYFFFNSQSCWCLNFIFLGHSLTI